MSLRRRDLLAGTALFILAGVSARAAVLHGALPWQANAGDPPKPSSRAPGIFSTAMKAAPSRRLPTASSRPIPQTPGGKDAGCAVYLDRQLAGPYGHKPDIYNRPPFMTAPKNFGPQSESDIAKTYRDGLAALDRYCTANKGGKHFAELSDGDKDELLKGLESGKIKLEGADGKAFFEQALKDIQQGFFADPIYGGNRDMVAWKMIGFPGARYNYLDWIDRHNERYPAAAGQPSPAAPNGKPKAQADMARKLPHKDVVIVGLGWTGSILAHELTDAGPRRHRHRARAMARHADRFPGHLRPGRAALSHPPRAVPAARRRPPSPSATRRTRPRCRSATGARSCRPTASAAAACTGTPRPGASCRATSCCKTHLTQRYGAKFLPDGHDDPGLGRHL